MLNKQHLKAARKSPETTLFLDIETTGLSRDNDYITLIGWSLDNRYGVWINGAGQEELQAIVAAAQSIITFNGLSFDLPFIRRGFPDLCFPQNHIDLRYWAKALGLTGGQKKIEQILGIARPTELIGMAGDQAPLLWYRYQQGDHLALKQLIHYNQTDIEGLKGIFDHIVKSHLPESR